MGIIPSNFHGNGFNTVQYIILISDENILVLVRNAPIRVRNLTNTLYLTIRLTPTAMKSTIEKNMH